jgi:hypothetical protein
MPVLARRTNGPGPVRTSSARFSITPVRALTRSPEQARLPEGAEVVAGDIGEPDSPVPPPVSRQ